jgi:thiol-disulfide isomerase/thioredoxin
MKPLLLTLLVTSVLSGQQLVKEVRGAIARNDFGAGERLIAEHRKSKGEDPESILALSWLGRGAQAAQNWDAAELYASQTRKLCLDALKSRKLDDEPNLPLALGASIEVHGHTLAGRGQRIEAVSFLQKELKAWHDTSIRTRIQKNLHLLSLEGKPAPKLEIAHHLGARPVPLASLKGKPYILFFWAHWCGDCKYQGPILARLKQEYGGKGLVIVGPTQRYGYVAGGREAPPDQELTYIEQVRLQHYAALDGIAIPVSEENFKNWGSSTTPTLVLVDRKGIVKLYHPGKMPYEELEPIVKTLVEGS